MCTPKALTRFAVNGLGAHRLDVEVVDGYRYFVVRLIYIYIYIYMYMILIVTNNIVYYYII